MGAMKTMDPTVSKASEVTSLESTQCRQREVKGENVNLAIYVCLWILRFMSHGVVGAFYYVAYKAHKQVSLSMQHLIGIASLDRNMFAPVENISIFFIILHGFGILLMLLSSIYFRRISLGFLSQSNQKKSNDKDSWVGINFIKPMKKLLAPINPLLKEVEKSLHSGVGIVILEAIEIGLQSFQAYKMSYYVTTDWLNRLMVLIIVANCFSLPLLRLIQYGAKKLNFHFQYMSGVLILDLIFQLVIGLLVPILIIKPSYDQLNKHIWSYDNQYFTRDTWLAQRRAEWTQVFVTSLTDYISKATPGFAIFLRLCAIEQHFRLKGTNQSKKYTAEPKQTETNQPPKSGAFKINVATIFEAGLCVWGLIMVILHFQAKGAEDPNCILEAKPWGGRQGCLAYEASCYVKQYSLPEILDNAQLDRIETFIISHCRDVVFSPEIKKMHNLRMLKTYNITIAKWDLDAEISNIDHPGLQFVFMVKTNMTTIPLGLRGSNIPRGMFSFQLCGSNITTLPDDLAVKWSVVGALLLEQAQFETIPPVLKQFPSPMWALSVAGNKIKSFPTDFFANSMYFHLALSGNPLEDNTLPNSIGNTKLMMTFWVENTDVTYVPPKLVMNTTRQSSFIVHATNTPMCTKLIADKAPIGDKPTFYRAPDYQVECGWPFKGAFPLEIEEALRGQAAQRRLKMGK